MHITLNKHSKSCMTTLLISLSNAVPVAAAAAEAINSN